MSTDFRTGAETMEKKLKKDKFILYFTNFSRVVLYLFALGMLLWLNRNGIVNGKQWFGDISGMGMLLMRGVLFAGILAASIIVGWVLAKIEQYNRVVDPFGMQPALLGNLYVVGVSGSIQNGWGPVDRMVQCGTGDRK